NSAVVNIGDWNIDSDISKAVAHGLPDYKKIRSISITIRDDSDTTYVQDNGYYAAQSRPLFVISTDATNITLSGTIALQTTDFDSTGYNRGFLTITYID